MPGVRFAPIPGVRLLAYAATVLAATPPPDLAVLADRNPSVVLAAPDGRALLQANRTLLVGVRAGELELWATRRPDGGVAVEQVLGAQRRPLAMRRASFTRGIRGLVRLVVRRPSGAVVTTTYVDACPNSPLAQPFDLANAPPLRRYPFDCGHVLLDRRRLGPRARLGGAARPAAAAARAGGVRLRGVARAGPPAAPQPRGRPPARAGAGHAPHRRAGPGRDTAGRAAECTFRSIRGAGDASRPAGAAAAGPGAAGAGGLPGRAHAWPGATCCASAPTCGTPATAPAVVVGRRPTGVPGRTMPAYQVVNGLQRRAGNLVYDVRDGHLHWHFDGLARYRLLDAGGRPVLISDKVGFCFGSTDAIDLARPAARWNPPFATDGCASGRPAARSVRMALQVGWGDQYDQTLPGQSLDVTDLPNGALRARGRRRSAPPAGAVLARERPRRPAHRARRPPRRADGRPCRRGRASTPRPRCARRRPPRRRRARSPACWPG